MKSDRTALVLSIYPVLKPKAGGQHRLYHLIEAYKRAGFKVIQVAVYSPEWYARHERGPDDIPFPERSSFRFYRGVNENYLFDLLSGPFLLGDEIAWNSLLRKISQTQISLIHFEQPWLVEAVKKLKTLPNCQDALVIFGSQNIEDELKRKILEDLNKKPSFLTQMLEEVRQIDIEAGNIADATLVVTESDQEWFKKNTNTKRLLLIPNGVRYMNSTPNRIKALQSKIKAERWFSFVGSNHPPNYYGFMDMVGDALACFPPDVRLVVAGNVSDSIKPYLHNSRWKAINKRQVHCFRNVDNALLDDIILGAHGILLPIVTGGGSNLKTAEALVSQRHIIGTPQSFRGYEEYQHLSGISIAGTRSEFRAHIRDVALQPALTRNLEEITVTKNLHWDMLTRPLYEFISTI